LPANSVNEIKSVKFNAFDTKIKARQFKLKKKISNFLLKNIEKNKQYQIKELPNNFCMHGD